LGGCHLLSLDKEQVQKLKHLTGTLALGHFCSWSYAHFNLFPFPLLDALSFVWLLNHCPFNHFRHNGININGNLFIFCGEQYFISFNDFYMIDIRRKFEAKLRFFVEHLGAVEVDEVDFNETRKKLNIYIDFT
jgi:hypothetical protein